jgi:hypothetical protein
MSPVSAATATMPAGRGRLQAALAELAECKRILTLAGQNSDAGEARPSQWPLSAAGDDPRREDRDGS